MPIVINKGPNVTQQTSYGIGQALGQAIEMGQKKKKLEAFQQAMQQASTAKTRQEASSVLMPHAEDLDDANKINEWLDKQFPPVEYGDFSGFDPLTGAETKFRAPKESADPYKARGVSPTAPVGKAETFVDSTSGKILGSFFTNKEALAQLRKKNPNAISQHEYDRRKAEGLQREKMNKESTSSKEASATPNKLQGSALAKVIENERAGKPSLDGVTPTEARIVQPYLKDPLFRDALTMVYETAKSDFYKLPLNDQIARVQGAVDIMNAGNPTAGGAGGQPAVGASEAPPADLPPAAENPGAQKRDTRTGIVWESDGSTWKKVNAQ